MAAPGPRKGQRRIIFKLESCKAGLVQSWNKMSKRGSPAKKCLQVLADWTRVFFPVKSQNQNIQSLFMELEQKQKESEQGCRYRSSTRSASLISCETM